MMKDMKTSEGRPEQSQSALFEAGIGEPQVFEHLPTVARTSARSRRKSQNADSKPEKPKRVDIEEYFLKIASVVAERSTCQRHRIGAIAVKDKHILSTGYNGAPAGLKDCLELGCLRNKLKIPSGERHEICRAVHAEQNVIIQAALHGVSLEGSTIYCTHSPCILCAKMLVNARISRFVTFGTYSPGAYDAFVNFNGFVGMFEDAHISLEHHEKPPSEITYLD